MIGQTVRISRSLSLSEETWRTEVVSWWRVIAQEVTDDSVFVPIDDFLSKKRWFVATWEPAGGGINVSEEVRILLTRAESEFKAFKLAVEQGTVSEFDSDEVLDLAEYVRPLTDFQQEAVRKMLRVRAGANFSVPGAGKTSTTLALWNELRKRDLATHLLVVSPRSAFDAWQDEPCEIFAAPPTVFVYDDGPINSSAEIVLINYEKLEKNARLEHIKQWARTRKVHLVLDEAHRVKGGAKSVRWLRCKSLSSLVTRVDLLTGTPMPQGYDDLRNLMSISWPSVPRSFLTDSRLSRLGASGLFVRATKAQLKLPPVEIHRHRIEMGSHQNDIYKALTKSYSGIFRVSDQDESYFGAKGRAVMTLLAAASNPGLLMGISSSDAYMGLEWPSRDIDGDSSLTQLVSKYARHEVPAKYLWIAKYVTDAADRGQKVLIWSSFIGNIHSLTRLLTPFNPAVIYGALSQEERAEQLKLFREESSCNVLITNAQTLGEGVSLHHDCHEAIYLDRSYNAGQYLQSLDRIHRLGLEPGQVTNIHLLEAVGTIDERVGIRLEQKVTRLAEALDDSGLVKLSLPGDEEVNPSELLGFDRLDLDDILRHLGAQ
ncbi:DEAD/DEAH box helicase [Luminiphilus sp.]|nr:DEAD/DEAH box helicase [Luminiphilus sp.]MDA9625514.1 DEAD/DEAH box helicase [Luminiphilus sp.]